jgi:hypothetical protein
MNASIIKRNDTHFTVQVQVSYKNTMLDFEESIQSAVNEAGLISTKEALSQFDVDGSPIIMGANKFTSKGTEPKVYQTPYGAVDVHRHVYQGSKGGKTYCPLETNARIVVSSTPKFAKIVSSKYADLGASRVRSDLEENHGRTVARCFIQDISEAVGAVILAKEESWGYALPKMGKPVKTIAIGMDGTCMLLCDDGYREAMVGTIAFYDRGGDRQHTTYMAATPEYGKDTFLSRFEQEILKVKRCYPKVTYVGVADGAKCNWPFLKRHTDTQTIDFWHVTEYLGKAANVMFRGKRKEAEKSEWLDQACHKLKHSVGSASRLLTEMAAFNSGHDLPKERRGALESTITYFTNNKNKMKYAQNLKKNLPIGSGVTEAACKVIVKQRLCGSAMKWKEKGAAAVLSLRSMNYSDGRWQQFWQKINQFGMSVAA